MRRIYQTSRAICSIMKLSGRLRSMKTFKVYNGPLPLPVCQICADAGKDTPICDWLSTQICKEHAMLSVLIYDHAVAELNIKQNQS